MTWNDLKPHRLTVYTTAWCPDCRRLLQQLAAHGLSWTEKDIDLDSQAASFLHEKTGRTAIPFVDVDGRGLVPGWHEHAPGRWDEQRFLTDIQDLLSGSIRAP